MRRFLNILLILYFSFTLYKTAKAETITIKFYSETIQINYSPDIQFKYNVKIKDSKINANDAIVKEFYETFEKKDFSILLNSLQYNKKKLKLNDWLYYRLTKITVDELFEKTKANYKTLICWFILIKSGYYVRLGYAKREIYLYVYTKNTVYNIKRFKERGKYFVNLTNLDRKLRNKKFFKSKIKEGKNDKNFSFNLDTLPNLKSENIIHKEFSFYSNDKFYNIKVLINETFIKLSEDYPNIDRKSVV